MNEIRKLADLAPGPWAQIVGIPRGGLIVAAALGYELGTTRVAAFTVAYRRRRGLPPVVGRETCTPLPLPGESVLVVEDGTDTGTLLEHARAWLEDRAAVVTTASLWVRSSSRYRPDRWVSEVDVLPSGRSLLGLPEPAEVSS